VRCALFKWRTESHQHEMLAKIRHPAPFFLIVLSIAQFLSCPTCSICVLHLCYRPLIRTLGITVRWHTAWSSHRHRRARTALSSRRIQVSSSRPSSFEICAGPTSSLKWLPRTTMEKVSAAVLKWWWVSSAMPFVAHMYADQYIYIYCTGIGLCAHRWHIIHSIYYI